MKSKEVPIASVSGDCPDLVTKEVLLDCCEKYWSVCSKAAQFLEHEHPGLGGYDVTEIHVDPEEDYVFVSWAYPDYCGYNHTSTSYKINKFLTKINELEEKK